MIAELGFELQVPDGGQVFVPKGRTRIAQRFNAGTVAWVGQVPQGRLSIATSSRPFGTQPSIRPHPALKRWAIFRHPSGMTTLKS
jgi:hypothetical protein